MEKSQQGNETGTLGLCPRPVTALLCDLAYITYPLWSYVKCQVHSKDSINANFLLPLVEPAKTPSRGRSEEAGLEALKSPPALQGRFLARLYMVIVP